MMPAAKHGDPQIGIDVHLCAVPPSPSPVPLPTPHTSIVFDPFDYVPFLGATITVCGMKRATAGSSATAIHIPPGFPFTPKLPDREDEIFMGSATVVADGDPFSFTSVPTLSCQIAGIPSPPRPKKKKKNLMMLPTTVNLAIPTNVVVGGPPTISLMGMAFKVGFAALGKFAKSGLFKKFRMFIADKLNLKKPGFLRCVILRAEPVSILNGSVSVEQQDFILPGRIPIEWNRAYRSDSQHTGVCGRGWETLADTRMEISSEDGLVLVHSPSFGLLSFGQLPAAVGEEAVELEFMDGSLLADHGDEYRITTKEDRIYHFPKNFCVRNEHGQQCWPIGRISDLCGNTLTFVHHGGQVVSIEESAGRRLALFYENDRLTAVTLIDQTVGISQHTFVRYQYDKNGDLVSVIDALENPYTFAYDEHRMVRHTDRNGLSFYYAYEQSAEGEWRVVHAWGDEGLYDYTFEYFDEINERRITDSLGNVSTVKLNEAGLPISEIDPLDGMTIFEYDEVGRTTAVTDPSGRRTEYAYDASGNLLTLTRPDGKSIETAFSPANKAERIIDPNGNTWVQSWDERGLLIAQTTPLGSTSAYEYDRHGQLAAFTNAREARTRLAFDSTGNLTSIKDALGHSTHFVYDQLGNVIAKTDPLGHTTRYRYDAKSRLTAAELPSGAMIRCAYDPEDNLTRYVDENGAETRLEYFGQGEIKRRIQPDGHTVEYQYDTEERLIGVKNQRGESYRLERDALGRIVREVDYWDQARQYSYDAGGNLAASTDPLGRTIAYATDPLGRILTKTLPDGFCEAFAYDANGNLTETRNPHAEIKRSFDAEGRLTEEAQGDFVIRNSYDANGNRISRETSLGNIVAYEYNALDQAVGIRINRNEPIEITRDALGRVAREQLSPQLARSLSYSADGYLTSQAVSANELPLFATEYRYDAAGNLTERRDSRYGTDTFRYDPMGRIVEHLDPHKRLIRYLNDPAGDRLLTRVTGSRPALEENTAPAQDEWLREGRHQGTLYRFDRAGNLVERRDSERDLRLVWDANQRLLESHANGTITRYGYDPLGRRLFKETHDRRTVFCWDGDALLAETVVGSAGLEQSAAGRPPATREYLCYPQTFEPLALIENSTASAVYYYHTDPNGCPVRLTDARGAVKWAARYTAWGGIAELYADDVAQPIRLQGQYADDETGLYYNRYRYFDAESGQFVSADPLGLAAGSNVYEFAANAAGWVDPLGLTQCSLDEARKLAANVPDKFKALFKCKEFAANLKKAIMQNGLHAEEIILKSDTDRIWSEAAGKVITKNGDHVGIKVGDHVFDNLNPQGIHIDKWMDDLGVGFPGMRPPIINPF